MLLRKQPFRAGVRGDTRRAGSMSICVQRPVHFEGRVPDGAVPALAACRRPVGPPAAGREDGHSPLAVCGFPSAATPVLRSTLGRHRHSPGALAPWAPARPAADAIVARVTPPIRLHDVSHRYGALPVLDGVSLQVEAGEFVALLGPSGCGKSSLLRLVAGLEDPTAGTVDSPARRSGPDPATACVFQEPTLMPWATVEHNVWLPLRLRGVALAEARPRIAAVLAQVGLADFAQARPAQLSGGMKMRASIARALVTAPQVLLMDEPFAALDELTRQRLNDDLLQWCVRSGVAVLFVTHSVAEAVFLSRRVLVMGPRPGRVVAEVPVDEPTPRAHDFRHSPPFAAACRAASRALEAAA